MIILPILTTSPIHFSLKGWENVLFERMAVKGLKQVVGLLGAHMWVGGSDVMYVRTEVTL